MRKSLIAFLIILLTSVAVSVASPQKQNTSPYGAVEDRGIGKSEEVNNQSNSYIIKLEDEPILESVDTESERNPGVSSQSIESQITSQENKIQENRERFSRNLQKKAESSYTVKERYENTFNGLAISNLSKRTVEEIKQMSEVEGVYKDRVLHVQIKDSVENVGASRAHNLKADGENITGRGVEVAVLDTGVDYTHPDLGGCTLQQVNNSDNSDCRFLPGYDFVDENYDPMDEREHGTHVSGILGANGNSLTGVAPEAKIRAYRVCGSYGCSTSNILSAVDRAVDPDSDGDPSDHVDILQMSIGGPGFPSDPLSEAMNDAAKIGVTPIISAGNSGSAEETVGSPAAAEKALAVASVNDNDRLNQFSSRGPQKVKESTEVLLKPEISAPGDSIDSTVPGGSTARKSGTSMAAPHVSGAAALILQKYEDLETEELQSLLVQTASPVEEDNRYNSVGPMERGSGRLNVTEALSTSSVVTPKTLSFGLSNSTDKWWNTSKTFDITNFGDSTKNYFISENLDVNGADLGFNESTIVLDPGEEKSIEASLSLNKEAVDKGRFTGNIKISSNRSEKLTVPYLFIHEDFSINVTPKASKDGRFRLHIESPMEFDKFFKKIYVEKPDGSVESESILTKGAQSELRPKNQNFEGEIEFSQPGEYKAIVNSTELPGKEASVNFTVETEKPALSESARFKNSNILEINVSSDSDIGISSGRRIPLSFDFDLWSPELVGYKDENHIFWDYGGYNTDLRWSKFENGEISTIEDLQFSYSTQVKSVNVEKSGSKALAVWHSSSSGSSDCPSYCTQVHAALVDLQEEQVKQRYNLTQKIDESDIEDISTAINGDIAAVNWLDDRANRSRFTFLDRNLSVMMRTFNFSSESFSDLENISYNEPLTRRSGGLSTISSTEGFEVFWQANRETNEKTKSSIFYRKYFSNGTKTDTKNITRHFNEWRFSYSCERIDNETLCLWRQPTSDAGGEIYSASSDDWSSKKFLEYSQGNGELITSSTESKIRTVYFKGSYVSGYPRSYKSRVYDGTWSESKQVVDDTGDYSINSIDGKSGDILSMTYQGDSIPTSEIAGIRLDSSLIYNLRLDRKSKEFLDPKYPVTDMKLVENDNSYLTLMDSRARSGYYNWLSFGDTNNFLMRISKQPESSVTLPNGTKIGRSLQKIENEWSGDISTSLGGTHIFKINATDNAFQTSSVKGFVTRNISDGNNSPPEKPEWRGVGSTTENRKPLLNWTEVNDPDGDNLRYILMLDQNKSFSSPEVLANLNRTSFTPERLKNGEYNYRVYATDGFQDGQPLEGSFNITRYVNFTLTDNLSVGDDLEITANESDRFTISKDDWSYTGELIEEAGNYSRKISLHNYGYYNITVFKKEDSGEKLGSKTKKIFVNTSRPRFKDLKVDGVTSRKYPPNKDKFSVSIEFEAERGPLNGNLSVSNSTWFEEFDISIDNDSISRTDPITGEEYRKIYNTALSANLSNLSGSNYSLSINISNVAGKSKKEISLTPDYVNFSVSNQTTIGSSVDVESNESLRFNISRGNWSHSSYLYRDYDTDKYTNRFQLHREGYYNISVWEENPEGEILSKKKKKIKVSGEEPKSLTTTLSSDYPLDGESFTAKAQFESKMKPINGSFTFSNATWSRKYSGNLTYTPVEAQDPVTGENYTRYRLTEDKRFSPLEMTGSFTLEKGQYNLSTQIENTEGILSKNKTVNVLGKRNITLKIKQDKNKSRTIAIFPGESQSTYWQESLKDRKNITVPNLTSISENSSIAVTGRNITENTVINSYIRANNINLGDRLKINISETRDKTRKNNRIFYYRFSAIFKGKNDSENFKLLTTHNSTKIKERVNSFRNLTLYSCSNYDQDSDRCLSQWKRPNNVQKSTYSNIQLQARSNYSQALALGEPIRSCYPECDSSKDNENDESDGDETSRGDSGGSYAGSTSSSNQKPVLEHTNDTTIVSHLERGKAELQETENIESVRAHEEVEKNYRLEIEEINNKEQAEPRNLLDAQMYSINLYINGEPIESAETPVEVNFSVRESWLENREISPESVSLYHRESEVWEPVETSYERTGRKHIYSARISEFSRFMIAAEKKQNCIQVVTYARNPADGSCQQFPTPCDVPENWEEVNSCQTKQTENRTANSSKEKPENESNNTNILLPLAAAAILSLVAGALSITGIRHHRKKKEIEELESITEIIREEMEEGDIPPDKEILDLLTHTKEALSKNNPEEASRHLEKIKENINAEISR